MGLMERVKAAMRTWLNIEPAADKGGIRIRQPLTHEGNVLKNRIWYRGDASEIEQFFKGAGSDSVNQSRFWTAVPSLPIRKIHLDVPTQIVNRLVDIVASDFTGFEITPGTAQARWDEIAEDCNWQRLMRKSLQQALVTGDGAFKISNDPEITKLPIIEFWPADRVSYVDRRGRLHEIVFHTLYQYGRTSFRLDEHYGPDYINCQLYALGTNGETEVALTSLPETADMLPSMTTPTRLAVRLMVEESDKFEGRGSAVYDAKTEAFDALDEVISEWWDDYRKGRVKQFLPDDMFPRDASTGELLRPSPFDDVFVRIGTQMAEEKGGGMQTFSPDIRADRYFAGYAQALDMCLQGIISPSTLGIDLKKQDNAEAQREKEKATMFTRSKIIDALNEAWPELVKTALEVAGVSKAEVTVTFGEYSSPSFDQQLETMAVAAQWNLMSIEQTVDELWGDTKDDAWKDQEVERIKELRGVVTLGEPAPGGPLPAAKPMTGVPEDDDNDQPEGLPNGTEPV